MPKILHKKAKLAANAYISFKQKPQQRQDCLIPYNRGIPKQMLPLHDPAGHWQTFGPLSGHSYKRITPIATLETKCQVCGKTVRSQGPVRLRMFFVKDFRGCF